MWLQISSVADSSNRTQVPTTVKQFIFPQSQSMRRDLALGSHELHIGLG
jgi:hypothetical protein